MLYFMIPDTTLGKGLMLSQTTNLDSSKLKEFAGHKFRFDDNGRKFSKQLENTVGKGEIACYEQFLLFHGVFNRLVLQTHKNQGLFGKGLRIDILCCRFLDFVKV